MDGKKITIADILDLLDSNRESDEIVNIMGGDKPLMRGKVCSPYWKDLERRAVVAIEAGDGGQLNIWLEKG